MLYNAVDKEVLLMGLRDKFGTNISIATYLHSRNREIAMDVKELGWSKFVGACLELYNQDDMFKDKILRKMETY
jgi:hypothetical protein